MRTNAKDQIMRAADGLFGEVGFDAATTREIAQRSGVNKALIHYHFKSKEALFESVLDRYYKSLDETLRTALSGEGNFRRKMNRAVDAYFDFLARNINFSRIVQRESGGGPHQDRIRGHLLPMFKLGLEMMHQSFPQTQKGDMAAHHLLVSLYGMIVSYFTYSGVIEGLVGQDPLSRAALAERKRHVHLMLDVIEQTLGNGSKKTKDRARG